MVIPVIPKLGKLKQEDHKFYASQNYIIKTCFQMKQRDKPTKYVYKGPRVAKAIMDKKSTRQPGRILPHMIQLTLHAVVTKPVWYWDINTQF